MTIKNQSGILINVAEKQEIYRKLAEKNLKKVKKTVDFNQTIWYITNATKKKGKLGSKKMIFEN